MSAPAWLLDAIHATESAPVPNVPNTVIQLWVQSDSHETLLNKGVVSDVPSDPTVPKEIQSPWDELGISAWMWQVNLADKTMIVTTSPSSTTAEMKAMYPTAISLEAIE